MNKIVKDALILTAITLIAGLALGAVYQITKAPIEKANQNAITKAYKEVFAAADSFGDLDSFDATEANKLLAKEGYTDGTITQCEITDCDIAYDANKNAIGYVVSMTSHAGYGGDIEFIVGITSDKQINGYSITSISETAGLGMKAKDATFADQFKNIAATTLEVSKTGSDSANTIQAISGATITSKAMTYGVNAAVYYVSSIGGGANE